MEKPQRGTKVRFDAGDVLELYNNKPERMSKSKKGCVDDLATLSELNEEIILQELQARYNQDVIYVRKLIFSRVLCRKLFGSSLTLS